LHIGLFDTQAILFPQYLCSSPFDQRQLGVVPGDRSHAGVALVFFSDLHQDGSCPGNDGWAGLAFIQRDLRHRPSMNVDACGSTPHKSDFLAKMVGVFVGANQRIRKPKYGKPITWATGRVLDLANARIQLILERPVVAPLTIRGHPIRSVAFHVFRASGQLDALTWLYVFERHPCPLSSADRQRRQILRLVDPFDVDLLRDGCNTFFRSRVHLC